MIEFVEIFKQFDAVNLVAIGAMGWFLNKSFNTKFNSLRKEMNERIDSVEQRIHSVEQRIHSVELRLTAIECRLTAVEDRLDHLEVRLESVETHLMSCGSRLTVIETILMMQGYPFKNDEKTKYTHTQDKKLS